MELIMIKWVTEDHSNIGLSFEIELLRYPSRETMLFPVIKIPMPDRYSYTERANYCFLWCTWTIGREIKTNWPTLTDKCRLTPFVPSWERHLFHWEICRIWVLLPWFRGFSWWAYNQADNRTKLYDGLNTEIQVALIFVAIFLTS